PPAAAGHHPSPPKNFSDERFRQTQKDSPHSDLLDPIPHSPPLAATPPFVPTTVTTNTITTPLTLQPPTPPSSSHHHTADATIFGHPSRHTTFISIIPTIGPRHHHPALILTTAAAIHHPPPQRPQPPPKAKPDPLRLKTKLGISQSTPECNSNERIRFWTNENMEYKMDMVESAVKPFRSVRSNLPAGEINERRQKFQVVPVIADIDGAFDSNMDKVFDFLSDDDQNNELDPSKLQSLLKAHTKEVRDIKDDLKNHVSTSELWEILKANNRDTLGSELCLRHRWRRLILMHVFLVYEHDTGHSKYFGENREDGDIGDKGEAAPNMLSTLMKTSSKDIGSSKRRISHALEPGNHIYCLYDPEDAEITAYQWDPRVKGLFFTKPQSALQLLERDLPRQKWLKGHEALMSLSLKPYVSTGTTNLLYITHA
nr:poly [ADP-ribose] polymerase 1 [Tanacetum cinerariifolium]